MYSYSKYRKGININKAADIIIKDENLKKMSIANSKVCKNEKERKIFELGFQTGIDKKEKPEEYENNVLFNNGYNRAIRIIKLKEYEQKQEIARQMAENNIPFENAPEEIKKDKNLEATYKLHKIQYYSKNKTIENNRCLRKI